MSVEEYLAAVESALATTLPCPRGADFDQLFDDIKKVLQGDKNASVKPTNGVPWGSYPYGDNLDDQPNIGIRYARERGY